jgi:hypothetical protein
MQLPYTSHALAELSGLDRAYQADHQGRLIRVADSGMVVGEEDFDINRHEVSDINPFSLTNFMGGGPQVEFRLPEEVLPVNIIVHSDPKERDDPETQLGGRKILTRELQRALEDALPQGDLVSFYVAGYQDPYLLERRAQYLPGTEKPADASDAIARLSLSGLSVVIGTFQNLSFDQLPRPLRSTVGIKVNHPWDLQLEEGTGEHDTGHPDPDFRVVQTDRGRITRKLPQQLLDYRVIQAEHHQAIMARLQSAGLHMAQAIFDKQSPVYTDDRAVDKSISQAVQAAGRQS